MSLDDFIVKVDGLLRAIESEMPNISDEIALNALALVKNRIIDKRQGIPGASYSTKPMLATKEQFVVKSKFKQSTVEETRFHRRKDKKNVHIGRKTKRAGDEKKVVKRKLWIKFPKAKKAVPVMLLEGGYRQFREIQGRPGDHVNASLTGKMWQGATITARVRNANTWVTIIGGSNKEAQDKLLFMTQKFGQFLAVLPEEIELLDKVYAARLQSLIDRFIK